MVRVAVMIPVGRGRERSYLHNLQSLALQSAPAFDLLVFSDCCESDLVKLTQNRTSHSNAFNTVTVLNSKCEISLQPVGCGGARYYLYEEARRNHDLVCSIDDDCQVMPDWLGTILEAYELFPEIHIFTTSVFNHGSVLNLGTYVSVRDGYFWPRPNRNGDRRFRLVDWCIGTSSIFCREGLSVQFDPELHVCEDIDMYFNMRKHGISGCMAIRDAVMLHKPFPDDSGAVPGFRTSQALRDAVIRIYRKHNLKHGPLWHRVGAGQDLDAIADSDPAPSEPAPLNLYEKRLQASHHIFGKLGRRFLSPGNGPTYIRSGNGSYDPHQLTGSGDGE